MKIVKNIEVPTGNICVVEGEHGLLEFLSIGDYGKEKNLKADFLGLEKEINGVPHGGLLPLEDKWVITISTQYGCSMGCTFCDVPKVGPGRNATIKDMVEQVLAGIALHPEVRKTKRLNLHFARMGEPTLNQNVLEAAYVLSDLMEAIGFGFHPVISTMMPINHRYLTHFLTSWLRFKNRCPSDAGLQISINTTDESLRTLQFGNNALSLFAISELMESLIGSTGLTGRKIALNFALHPDYPIDAKRLVELFNPEFFLCKITPMHATTACDTNELLTPEGYEHYIPYKETEERLKAVGYDVIVFIPSKEEDESLITCGNAVLATRKFM